MRWQCRKCAERINPDASRCPHCGHRHTRSYRNRRGAARAMLVLSLPIVTLPITLPCYLFHKWRLGRLQARDPHCGQPAVPVDTPRKRTGPADGRVTTDAYDSAAPPEIEGGESPDVDANPGGDAA